jgi:hypothetical protein
MVVHQRCHRKPSTEACSSRPTDHDADGADRGRHSQEEVVEADGFVVAARVKIVAGKKVAITPSPDSRVAVPAWEDIVRAHRRKLVAKALRRTRVLRYDSSGFTARESRCDRSTM